MTKPPASLRYVCKPHLSQCMATLSVLMLERKKELELKKYRKETKRRKTELNKDDKRYWKERATTAFHKWVREVKGKDQPCISCGRHQGELKPNAMGQFWDAGHFLTKAAHEELRFVEDNVWKQCKSCNGGQNKIRGKDVTITQEYERRLRLLIGDDRVDWLKGPHEQARLRADDYKAIEIKYKQKLKELE